MGKKFRERCAEGGVSTKGGYRVRMLENTLVINTLFQINTASLAKRNQDLDIPFYTVTNNHYYKF